MNGWFRRLLFRNLLLKLISLGLALLLFAMVRSEKQSLAQGVVRLSYSVPVGKLLVSELPSQVTIVVRGSASRMHRFRFEELSDVHIDLSTVKEGYYRFTEDMVQLPKGLTVTSVRPSGAQVRFERLAQRRIPVVPTIQGQVKSGFQLLKRTVSPTEVMVTGPRRLVLEIQEVNTRPVSVEGATSNMGQLVELMGLPAKVTANPARGLRVDVEVAPVTSEVTLKGVPVEVLDPANRPSSVSPRQILVTLTGPTTLLASIPRAKLVAWAELHHGAWGTIEIKPAIRGLPSGVTVLKARPEVVKVTIGGGGEPPAPKKP